MKLTSGFSGTTGTREHWARMPVLSGIFMLLSSLSVASAAESRDDAVQAFFSQSYQEARQKFLAAARDAGGEISRFRNPGTGSGSLGEALSLDTASFGVDGADCVLVIGSGTHGVEGFAGSAIQTGLLRTGFSAGLDPGVGLFFYHALNPYGFSHLRRFNEDNVDLNRNFVDHSLPHPVNVEYDRLAGLIEPETPSRWQELKTRFGVAWHRMVRGRQWLQRALSTGQYKHPRGLFYGGNQDTWSNRTLRTIVERYLSGAKRVVVIDVHTGLGEFGSAEIIVGEPPGSASFERAWNLWGDLVKSPEAGDSVSPPVKGPLKNAFARMLPHSEVTAVSLEFGTYPPPHMFWALWRENIVHHHAPGRGPNQDKLKLELLRAFYPDDRDWRHQVWTKGRTLSQQALDGLPGPDRCNRVGSGSAK